MTFDTDVMIWFLRGKEQAAEVIESASRRNISCVTYGEILQGARTKKEMKTIQKLLRDWEFQILMLNDGICQKAMFFVEEYALSHGIQWADALISATVIHEGETLVTANAKHFTCIPGLELKLFNLPVLHPKRG